MNKYDFLFKFIVIGDTGVGKSCIVLQFIENKTRSHHDVTIGVEFGARKVRVNDHEVKLQIWDTAGQESFRSITRSYYRSCIGALLIYDITRRSTFENVKSWIEEVRNNGNSHMQILLVGNKSDLWDERTVLTQEGEDMAQEYNLKFIEISAKDYHKVESAFKTISEEIIQKIGRQDIPVDPSLGVKTGNSIPHPSSVSLDVEESEESCMCY